MAQYGIQADYMCPCEWHTAELPHSPIISCKLRVKRQLRRSTSRQSTNAFKERATSFILVLRIIWQAWYTTTVCSFVQKPLLYSAFPVPLRDFSIVWIRGEYSTRTSPITTDRMCSPECGNLIGTWRKPPGEDPAACIRIDFSPKGGPRNFIGYWDGTGIKFPVDGNN